MAYDKIIKALEQHIEGVTGLPDLVFENMDYEPTNGMPWVRVRFMPAKKEQATFGASKKDRLPGVLAVDVFTPSGKGPAVANGYVDDIINNFTSGEILTEDSQRVHIMRVDRAAAMNDGPWYMVPVSIYWYAFV